MKPIVRIYQYVKRNSSYLVNKLRLYLYNVEHKDVRIHGKIYIKNNGKISIGKNVYINSSIQANMLGSSSFSALVCGKNGIIKIGNNVGISNTSITAHKAVIIDDNVLIGNGCKIFDTDFHQIDSNKRIQNDDNSILCAEIKIGKNVFVGTGSVILKGVVIGENSIIGAQSVVTKSVPPNEIWAGNPAKKIKSN